MNNYGFQLKLHTLALCAVVERRSYDTFEFAGMKFTHWDFNFAEGHKPGAWLIATEIQAPTIREASKNFFVALNDLIPKIAMISQCYTEYQDEPFLIHRLDSDIAFFHYTKAYSGVPLSFDADSREALALLKDAKISNEFFYYWNDMLNTPGYPAKLLLIFSALEALGKALGKDKGEFRKEVLGDELRKKIFENGNQGIRNRLTHGEYFSEKDGEDYLAQIYEKMIGYFNENILKKNPIRNVVHPQRHPWGNKKVGKYYLKKTPDATFDLREMIKVCDKDFDAFYARYEQPTDAEIAIL